MLHHSASRAGTVIAAMIVSTLPLAALDVPVLKRTDTVAPLIIVPIMPAPAVIDGVRLNEVAGTTATVKKPQPVPVAVAKPPRRPSNLVKAQKPKQRPAVVQAENRPAIAASGPYVQVVQATYPRRYPGFWMTVGNGF